MSESTPVGPLKALEDPGSALCPVCGKPLMAGSCPHCSKAAPHEVATIESSRGLGMGIAVGVVILLFAIFLLAVWSGLSGFIHEWTTIHRF